MHAPASPAETKTTISGQSPLHREQEGHAGHHEDREHRQQHPALAVACRPSRPRTGPASAVVTAPAAATAPPQPVGPGLGRHSSTQPRPTIDSGRRPMKAASTIGRACGVRSTCR